MKKIITREDTKNVLIKWQNDELTESQVHYWADSLYPNSDVDYEDWENNEYSVTNEVLAALDMMDMNLMTKEDIPYYFEFLDTPVGQFELGYEKLKTQLATINMEQRQETLKNNDFYKNYLR